MNQIALRGGRRGGKCTSAQLNATKSPIAHIKDDEGRAVGCPHGRGTILRIDTRRLTHGCHGDGAAVLRGDDGHDGQHQREEERRVAHPLWDRRHCVALPFYIADIQDLRCHTTMRSAPSISAIQ